MAYSIFNGLLEFGNFLLNASDGFLSFFSAVAIELDGASWTFADLFLGPGLIALFSLILIKGVFASLSDLIKFFAGFHL